MKENKPQPEVGQIAEIKSVDMFPMIVSEEEKLAKALENADGLIAKISVDLERQKSRRDQIAGALMIVRDLIGRHQHFSGADAMQTIGQNEA